MKSKLLAAVIFVFLLCGVAAAQEDYYIRTDSRINLRATYSLEGEKVETVPEGTTLHVVGRFNRWLKIDRNGDIVWLADWVYYTRVDDGSQESSTSQDQFDLESFQIVDNCCQVDRQCNTEQEWTSGYWAFQNNHCVAPAQLQALSRHPGVRIEGSATFVNAVEQALDMLKNRAPHWYTYAITGLNTIRMAPSGSSAGAFVDTRIYGYGYDSAHVAGESDIMNMAGGIVHGACHVHRSEAGIPYHTDEEIVEEERACTQMQLEATEAVDPINRQSPWLRNLIANIENPEYWWWTD